MAFVLRCHKIQLARSTKISKSNIGVEINFNWRLSVVVVSL